MHGRAILHCSKHSGLAGIAIRKGFGPAKLFVVRPFDVSALSLLTERAAQAGIDEAPVFGIPQRHVAPD
jgi:hypothetical protein